MSGDNRYSDNVYIIDHSHTTQKCIKFFMLFRCIIRIGLFISTICIHIIYWPIYKDSCNVPLQSWATTLAVMEIIAMLFQIIIYYYSLVNININNNNNILYNMNTLSIFKLFEQLIILFNTIWWFAGSIAWVFVANVNDCGVAPYTIAQILFWYRLVFIAFPCSFALLLLCGGCLFAMRHGSYTFRMIDGRVVRGVDRGTNTHTRTQRQLIERKKKAEKLLLLLPTHTFDKFLILRETETARRVERERLCNSGSSSSNDNDYIETIDNTCIVCLSEYENSDKIVQLQCHVDHFFHLNCLREWMHRSLCCPVCRTEITEEIVKKPPDTHTHTRTRTQSQTKNIIGMVLPDMLRGATADTHTHTHTPTHTHTHTLIIMYIYIYIIIYIIYI
eukprot:GHVR01093093.1.p1 GENE.GHVR01093093.1~~GHVR01093093.1.p1  ORF type:complete len:389 (+),score=135.44 GHVR01093093.1:193-1359(+)